MIKIITAAVLVVASLVACAPKVEACPATGGPFVKGQDADYSKYADRDKDGVACE